MLYFKLMALNNRRSLISGVLFVVIGICYFIDGLQSHLNTLRIIGLLCWFSLGTYNIWNAFRERLAQTDDRP